MKKLLGSLFVVLFFAISAFAGKHSNPADEAKVNQLESAVGYTFLATRDSGVTVYHVTKNGRDIKVILAADSSTSRLVVFCTATPSATLPNDAAFYRTLLRYNFAFDQVKVGLDGDGDLQVRVDVSLRTLDAQELKTTIDQVANASDDILNEIGPQLVK